VVIITKKIDDHWFRGRLPGDKKEGVFPSSFVEILEQVFNNSGHRTVVFTQNLDIRTSTSCTRKAIPHRFHQFQRRKTPSASGGPHGGLDGGLDGGLQR